MKSQEIWEFLYLVLYDDQDISHLKNFDGEAILNPKINYRKFSVFTNFSECFDGEIAFLIEQDQTERLIWQDFESKIIQEIDLEKGTYQNVVESWLNYCDQILARSPIL